MQGLVHKYGDNKAKEKDEAHLLTLNNVVNGQEEIEEFVDEVWEEEYKGANLSLGYFYAWIYRSLPKKQQCWHCVRSIGSHLDGAGTREWVVKSTYVDGKRTPAKDTLVLLRDLSR
jgi:hypothetical protein